MMMNWPVILQSGQMMMNWPRAEVLLGMNNTEGPSKRRLKNELKDIDAVRSREVGTMASCLL